MYCATAAGFPNEHLRSFVCPALKGNSCPSYQDDIEIWIEKGNTDYKRIYEWGYDLPTSAAKDWNCKYKINADRGLIDDPSFEKAKIYVEINFQGFDNYVFLILQEHNMFRNVPL